jgi:serine/threonine protein phosphatase 1
LGRLIAIGDIHGHVEALRGIIRQIDPGVDDKLVFLGDYINRGPDSRVVVDELIELERQHHVVLIMGNHEEMLLEARHKPWILDRFMSGFEDRFFESYQCEPDLDLIPDEHWSFFERLRSIHVEPEFFFTHANYAPNMDLEDQSSMWLRWRGIDDFPPTRHHSGRTCIVGHVPQPNGKILDLEHCIGIDTGCGLGGVLTAIDVNNRELYQVDEQGKEV